MKSNAFVLALVVLFSTATSLLHTPGQGVTGKWAVTDVFVKKAAAAVVAISCNDSVQQAKRKRHHLAHGNGTLTSTSVNQ